MSSKRRSHDLTGSEVVVSCEHATARVPARFQHLFADDADRLESHEGWDAGAARLARRCAGRLGASLILGRCSRLLVDLNRSEDNPRVFSRFSRALPEAQREQLLEGFLRAHQRDVCASIDAALNHAPRVVHLSVHSFTPRWKGRERPTQLGLLDDPGRARERALSLALREALHALDASLRVHLNRPYRGTTDGLVSQLRRRYPATRYVGLELEFNQAQLAHATRWMDTLSAALGALLVPGRGSR